MTHGLSASELAQIRDDIDDLLPDTCNILTVTRTSDSQGGWSDAWGTATGGTAVPCRIDHKTAREMLASGELRQYQTTKLSLAYDVTITTANRVEVGSNTYSVTGVNYNQSWIGVKRVDLEKL